MPERKPPYKRHRTEVTHNPIEGALIDITTERNNALKRILGPNIEPFYFPDNPTATNIFHGLFNQVFDSGSNRNVSCNIQVGEKVVHLSEAAVPIHSRSSLITHSMEQIKQGKNVEFGMIDLQDFRDADFDLGEMDQGIHSADIIVNKSARVIRAALKEVWGELGFDYNQHSYELGRYGGDEFVIALFGDKAINAKETIIKKIQKKLESETGYYKKNGEIKELPIQLNRANEKDSVVEWLRPPESDLERDIYLEFFQRGTLFNKTEFARIISKYSPGGMLDMNLYRVDYPQEISTVVYPNEVGNDLNKKINFIKRNHPELIMAFDLAEYYDVQAASGTTMDSSRQVNLLKIIENSIFDRLLGDMIYSKAHFAEHLQKGEIDRLYILDFKFLKEINTGMTYADADMEIKKLWERIKSTLTEDDRKKILVSRFAGAFYIGVHKGEHLTNGEKLKEIKSVALFDAGNGEAYSVPVGYDTKQIHPHEYHKFYKAINKMEGDSDTYFYTELIRDIVDSSLNDSSFLDKMRKVDVGVLGKRGYQVLSKVELYSLLLKGKRKKARIKRLKGSVNEGINNMIRSFISGAKRHSFMEINKYTRRVREINDILMADLEENLSVSHEDH